ncbi:MAG: elongation factor Tu, partial [Methanomicrobium sp.]|nr:elongation factor Tu [Methanomicrobium sp.]
MPNLNVAITGSLDYAKNIGKKGTTSDITFYNLKKGEDTVTIIEPTRYPERIQPLYYAVSMADVAIVIVDAVTPEFGETVVMLDCAKVT